jgi:hypothetical protein
MSVRTKAKWPEHRTTGWGCWPASGGDVGDVYRRRGWGFSGGGASVGGDGGAAVT